MKKEIKRMLCIGAFALGLFVLWTILVCFVDVKVIGPNNSAVGFATLNGFVHRLTGVNMTLYVVTDWLGLVPLGIVVGFGALGLIQWIKRKRLLKVEFNLLVLGVFYLIVASSQI